MNQIIEVTNKAQLITAIGCAIGAIGVCEKTIITLIKQRGKTIYCLRPPSAASDDLYVFERKLKTIRNKIRKIKAECFR